VTTLPIETWGRGPTRALFLHGFAGSRQTFRHLEPLLGDAVTATCVDLPGHGDAALPGPGGFEGVVDALAGLLEAPTVVVGYSQGARLALGLAVRHPERVDRLVLESGSPGLHRRQDRGQRRGSDGALASLLLQTGVERFMDDWERQPLFAGLQSLPEAERAALRRRRTTQRAEGLAAALVAMGQGAQPDYWPALPRLLRPTLVLSGALDARYTRLARRMVQELPLGWRVTFPGVGHAPHLECREAYALELRNFLVPPWAAEPLDRAP
jgi:2-succinyl-6-hydroxy-2,4-cyclohexadiene-1-carboxylate synthase